ncbi:hypothetical protein Tco_0240629 [Tanacetum coccineum]
MKIQEWEIQKLRMLEEMKEWMNELGIREYRKERNSDFVYRRKCEDKIFELKDRFNCLSIEIGKITQEAKELRESEARIFIDDDDDDLGFYAVHPNTIHTPVSQNVESKDSLIMGDEHISITPETEAISVGPFVSNISVSDDIEFGGRVVICSTLMIHIMRSPRVELSSFAPLLGGKSLHICVCVDVMNGVCSWCE